jgi:mannose-6-phosphate isomerase-like protein (cupin superfamily)
MSDIATPDFARSSDDLHDTLRAQAKANQPSFFRMRAQLPVQGRTNVPLASSEKMWVVLKTYAQDGENELHAHPNEDHVFVVLQGQASFRGPRGEEPVGVNEGVLLPHGTFYWFKAVGAEPLVMLRVASAAFEGVDRHGRINIRGEPMPGDSAENKKVKPVMSEEWFG